MNRAPGCATTEKEGHHVGQRKLGRVAIDVSAIVAPLDPPPVVRLDLAHPLAKWRKAASSCILAVMAFPDPRTNRPCSRHFIPCSRSANSLFRRVGNLPVSVR